MSDARKNIIDLNLRAEAQSKETQRAENIGALEQLIEGLKVTEGITEIAVIAFDPASDDYVRLVNTSNTDEMADRLHALADKIVSEG